MDSSVWASGRTPAGNVLSTCVSGGPDLAAQGEDFFNVHAILGFHSLCTPEKWEWSRARTGSQLSPGENGTMNVHIVQ